MAGILRNGVVAGILVALAVSPVQSHWWGCYPSYRMTYYPVYPAPAYWLPAHPPCLPPMPPASPYAQPRPAPPSGTTEPSLQSPLERGPKVMESRWSGEVKTAKAEDKAPAGLCRVGFWNITGRDVSLIIDGQTHRIPRDRALTLNLARKFIWQLDQRAPRTEVVPDSQGTLELVLRPDSPR
jgi:hypothetical protein